MSSPVGPQQGLGLPWRATSSFVMGMTGVLSKALLFGFNRVEVHGLPAFLELLESRKDPGTRERGLITVSNHISVLDDPLMWGVLPLRYAFSPKDLRWGLGAHDICFKNKFTSGFFTYGQVLPTHRLKHSPHGGAFQPTITQAIRLLSGPSHTLTPGSSNQPRPEASDPFTTGSLSYSTNGLDSFPAPSAYAQNHHSWVHVFPEGAVHQHPGVDMRYFKWGISRLILESEPTPDVVPMFIDGNQELMPEDRKVLRFLPRVGKRVRVAFGQKLDAEDRFGDLRQRWKGLVARSRAARQSALAKTGGGHLNKETEVMGELTNDLKYGEEAQEIRVEVARRIRDEVLKLRRELQYPEPDATFALAETWAVEPEKKKQYKSRVDDSWTSQD